MTQTTQRPDQTSIGKAIPLVADYPVKVPTGLVGTTVNWITPWKRAKIVVES